MLALVASAHAEFPPPPFTAVYSLTQDGVELGETRRTLRSDGTNGYVFESVSQTTGLVALLRDEKVLERSQWTLDGTKVLPQRYRYERSGGAKRRLVELRFDWAHARVRNVVDRQPWSMSLPAGTLDKLLYQLVLMHDLQQGKTELNYAVADGGKVKSYRFVVAGSEIIQTDLGKLRALRLQISKDDKERSNTRLWCAERLAYLPVRIEQDDGDGGSLKMVLHSVTGLP
jgi:hypothetical protein